MVRFTERSVSWLKHNWSYYFEPNIIGLPENFRRHTALHSDNQQIKQIRLSSEEIANRILIARKLDSGSTFYELILAPPKTVSIALMAADEEEAEAILNAHDQAIWHIVTQFLNLQNSSRYSFPNLHPSLILKFNHYLSRNLDPHLHTHILIIPHKKHHHIRFFNRRIRLEYLKNLKQMLDKMFKIEESFGKVKSFRIACIPLEIENKYSSRRRDILENAQKFGYITYKTKNVSWNQTRFQKPAIINFNEIKTRIKNDIPYLNRTEYKFTNHFIQIRRKEKIINHIQNAIYTDYGLMFNEEELKTCCIILNNPALSYEIFKEMKRQYLPILEIDGYSKTKLYYAAPFHYSRILKIKANLILTNSNHEADYIIQNIKQNNNAITITEETEINKIIKIIQQDNNCYIIIRNLSHFNPKSIDILIELLNTKYSENEKIYNVIFIDKKYYHITTKSQRLAYYIYGSSPYLKIFNLNILKIMKNENKHLSFLKINFLNELISQNINLSLSSIITNNIAQTLKLIEILQQKKNGVEIKTKCLSYSNSLKYLTLKVQEGDQLIFIESSHAIPHIVTVTRITAKNQIEVITSNKAKHLLNTRKCILTPIEVIPWNIITKLKLQHRKLFIIVDPNKIAKIISSVLFSDIRDITLVFTNQRLRSLIKHLNIEGDYDLSILAKYLLNQSHIRFRNQLKDQYKHHHQSMSPSPPRPPIRISYPSKLRQTEKEWGMDL